MSPFCYITVLSNWILGYDKYKRVYSKEHLKRSTYPHEFYLLKTDDEAVGLEKARNLLKKVNIPHNLIVKIETVLPESSVKKNERNGHGWVVSQNFIPISKVFVFLNSWIEISLEELTARSFSLKDGLKSYSELSPRSLSVLHVGLACQARCWFCFSESSISKEKEKFKYELKGLKEICQKSQSLGAERFVITGGGEPGLLQFDNLLDMIRLAKKHFPKVVLISNGMFLSKETDEKLIHKLKHLEEAGLDVLSISRHSPHSDVNKEIMGVNIGSGRIFDFMNAHKIEIKKRLICVLQKMGVSNFDKIAEYLDYATFHQVDQVCFKELYVSSSLESL